MPSERVLAVEEATGVSRIILRPDLYPDERTASLDEVDAARAAEYRLLANLLARAPDERFLSRLAAVRTDASPLGLAHAALAEAAVVTTADHAQREYFDLFIGLGRGELLPYGSYYLTGFLHERPLARLREDLAQLEIERSEGNIEPEDHVAILCEVMAGLIDGRLGGSPGSDQHLFERHLKPWIGRFFADLERAEAAAFYGRVGTLGRVFIDIEIEAFALAS